MVDLLQEDAATIERLETEAARLRADFDSGKVKRPLVIEFSGLPKAGKTRTISVLELFLKRNNFNVEVFIERASIAPIRSKGHINFNTWVSCASLQGVLEALNKPELDIFILDRGIFDALMWTHWLRTTGKITTEEEDASCNFFGMDRWTSLVDLVVVMTCDPKKSIEREYSSQLTTKRGTIMSEHTLRQINASIDATMSRHGHRFKTIERVNTTDLQSRQTAATVTEKVLESLTTFIDEEICAIPAAQVSPDIPSKGMVTNRQVIDDFVGLVNRGKRFGRRSAVEFDKSLIQPIPCALIRWGDKVLLLKKKKRGHALHDKYLLWAGGHVNSSDVSGNKDVLLTALARELSEELFIKDNYEINPRPIALVRTDEDERASRHIGVLYEVTLTSDDVAHVMDREFKETRGMSMSARLASQKEVGEVYDRLNDWSKCIASHIAEGQTSPSAPDSGI